MAGTDKRIVVLGGGSGGLELASQLAGQKGMRVTLVDRDAAHVWKPRLHELATGTTATSLAEMSFYLLGQQRGFRFEQGTVEGLDRAGQTVTLGAMLGDDGRERAAPRQISYDVCVVALGGATPDFGTEGVAANAIRLDEKQDAERFRDRFIACMTQARASGTPAEIVIVGTGPTGIGLAAHLRDAEGGFVDPDAGGPASKLLDITLLEAAPELLPGAADDLRRQVTEHLRGLDVKLVVDAEIAEILAGEIVSKKGERWQSDLTVWATGNVGHPALKEICDLPLDDRGRIEVDAFLRCDGETNVYALGDAASFTPHDGKKPLAPTAQAAGQQAAYLARSLRRTFSGRTVEPFAFNYRGRLLSLGNAGAVGKLGEGEDDFLFAGQLAGAAYQALERQHQLRVLGPLRGGIAILADFVSPTKGTGGKLNKN